MGLRNHPSSSGGSDPRLCEPAVFVEGFRSRYFPLKQWLLRHGHQASSNITWERVRHSDSHCSPSQTHCIRLLRAEPRDLCFCSTLKCESHCSTRTTSFYLPTAAAPGQYCRTYSTCENVTSQGSSSDSRLWTPHWLLPLPTFVKAPRWWGRQSIRGDWNLRCAPIETPWAI